MRSNFNEFAREKGIPACMTGIGSMWEVHMNESFVTPRDRIKDNQEAVEEFNLRVRLEGIFVPEHSHIAFISTAHSEQDIDVLIQVLKTSLTECFT